MRLTAGGHVRSESPDSRRDKEKNPMKRRHERLVSLIRKWSVQGALDAGTAEELERWVLVLLDEKWDDHDPDKRGAVASGMCQAVLHNPGGK
jgi:hypothetical protein